MKSVCCITCHQEYGSNKSFKRHICDPDNNRVFKCDRCDFVGSRRSYTGHRSHCGHTPLIGDLNPARRPEVRAKMSASAKIASKTPARLAVSCINLKPRSGDDNVSRRPDVRAKLKANANRPEWIAQSIQNMLSGQESPNKSEKILLWRLKKLEPQAGWTFSGDGRLMIGRRSPDFIALNEPHRLVELFGEHVHKPEEEQSTVEYYQSYGYDCRVIWWKDLRYHPEVIPGVLK